MKEVKLLVDKLPVSEATGIGSLRDTILVPVVDKWDLKFFAFRNVNEAGINPQVGVM